MSASARRLALVAVVATLLLGVVTPAVAAQQTANTTSTVSTGDTLEEADVGLTLSELRRGGPTIANNPDTVRVDRRMWWLVHWPADAVLGDAGELTDTFSEFVSRGETVSRNSVYLRTNALNPPEQPHTLKIVYWREGMQETTGPDGSTVEKPVARDVVVDTAEVSLYEGMNIHEIPLRTSDETRKVTMWMEDNPDIRWTFEHESVATTAGVGIDTQGDYLWSVGTQFIIPIIIGSAITGSAARKAIKRAGLGPGYPVGYWIVAVAILAGVGMWWFFTEIATLVSWAPQLIAGVVVVVVGLVVLESQAVRDRDVAFIQPHTRLVEGPDGEEAHDSVLAASAVERVVDFPDGSSGVVKPGLFAFLARWRGAAARLPSQVFETRIKTPTGPWSEIVIVDPDAQTVLDYEPEGWRLAAPDIEDRDDLLKYGLIAVALAAGGVVAWTELSPLWAAGGVVLGVVALLAEPVDGRAEVEPASAHVREAWVTTITMSQEVDDAHTLDEARETLVSKQSETQQEIQKVVEKQDATLVESALGMDVDRGVEDEDSGPEDIDLEDAIAKVDSFDVGDDGEEEPADD